MVFGGVNDAQRGVERAETERNITFMVQWLRAHGIRKVVLIGPALANWRSTPDWTSAADEVRTVLRDVAGRSGAVYVDLTLFLRRRIERGEGPDFSRVPLCPITLVARRRTRTHTSMPMVNAWSQKRFSRQRLAGGFHVAAVCGCRGGSGLCDQVVPSPSATSSKFLCVLAASGRA